MRKAILMMLLAVVSGISGCNLLDDNTTPVYGKESGLPVNCRAYVQAAVDGYREKKYTADEIMNGLERNCGRNGHSWKDNR